MNFGPITTATTIAIRPAMRTGTMLERSSLSSSAMPSSPTARDALTRTASPGLDSARAPPRARRPASRAHATGPYARASLAHADHLDPELGRERCRSRGGSRSASSPSSAISPRIATRRRPPRALGEMLERGPHRVGFAL